MGKEVIITKTAGRGLGRFIGAWFKYGFYALFILILIIQAVVLSYSAGNIEPAINLVKDTFLKATLTLQEKSLLIIENEGLSSGLSWFGVGFSFVWAFWSIFLQIKVFTWFTKLSDSSRKATYWILAIMFFIIVQVVGLLVLYEPLDGQTKIDLAMTPIIAFIDFFRALPYFFSSFSFDLDFSSNNTCVDSVCQI